MTLRKQLALRYGTIVIVCLLLLAGLAHHEFIGEPGYRRDHGVPEPPETPWGEYVEVFFYGMIPVVLGIGWWAMRRTLAPISTLARAVDSIDAHNLREPLPRTGKGDEVDRLTEAFNTMTARLDHSFQQIREFTLHASHELKTPLTVMRGELETAVLKQESYSTQQRECMYSLLEEVERLTKIVNALTLLTKADAGQVNLDRKPVNLAELLRESFEDAQILAGPNKIKVALTDCAEVIVSGDRHRLRQLLLNLVDNAIKYNQPAGTVTLALQSINGMAEIEVANTGDGIATELLPRVFERFVRGDEARAKASDGCGLGLTIAQWIAQAHAGSIEISSQSGSTRVVVRLPLATSH